MSSTVNVRSQRQRRRSAPFEVEPRLLLVHALARQPRSDRHPRRLYTSTVERAPFISTGSP